MLRNVHIQRKQRQGEGNKVEQRGKDTLLTGARLGPWHSFAFQAKLSRGKAAAEPLHKPQASCELGWPELWLGRAPVMDLELPPLSSLPAVLTLGGGCSFHLQPEIRKTNEMLLEILLWHWFTTGQRERTVSGMLGCFGSPGGRCQGAAPSLCHEHLHSPVSTLHEFKNTNSKLCGESS